MIERRMRGRARIGKTKPPLSSKDGRNKGSVLSHDCTSSQAAVRRAACPEFVRVNKGEHLIASRHRVDRNDSGLSGHNASVIEEADRYCCAQTRFLPRCIDQRAGSIPGTMTMFSHGGVRAGR